MLILRVDRDLSYAEIASVLADGPLEGDALARAEAAARQRFTRAKQRLRALCKEQGLVG